MLTSLFRSLVLSGFLTISAIQILFGQVVFKEIPNYEIRSSDSLFFDITATRSIIPLNGKWSVRPAGDEDAPKVEVNIPSVFEGEGELIFEKEFELTRNQVVKNTLELVFFSVNYTADISLNKTIIYRHSGGEYPFKVQLPRDILKSDGKNLLSISLNYKLDSKNSIPQKQRFLFSQNFGGIISDVYIHLKPDFHISKETIKETFSSNYQSVLLEMETLIKNNIIRNNLNPVKDAEIYRLLVTIVDDTGKTVKALPEYKFTLERNKDIVISQSTEIPKPDLWNPQNPSSYIIKQELFKADSLIDRTNKSIALYELKSNKEKLTLNGNDFVLKGVCYYPSYEGFGKLLSYNQIEQDISLIKEAGFNCVRFAKGTAHPYYLRLCEKYGLFAFLEIPINGVPSGIAEDEGFINRSKDFVLNYLSFYSDYSSFAAIGFGGTYLPQISEHISLISTLASLSKQKSNRLTYASFFGKDLKEIDDLDLYGLEFLGNNAADSDQKIKELQDEIGKGKIFFSSLTYPVYLGSSDGYLNEFSYEAQAKYFDGLFDYVSQNQIPAFFINSFTDYRGDYSSLICGYNETNLYHIGLLDENRSKNRISYKVVYSKLNNLEKVTIPIGNKKDDSPMVFIISGLLLAIFMGALVNSGRKFRDDASRALLRPYNFFSDIRDQRIISAYQTTILGLIIAAITALIISNLLFHLKNSIIFENFLLAFASPSLIKSINYLAWNPFMSLLWLTAFNIILFVIITLLIEIASFFAKTRVYIIGVYFTFIWALLPVVLLIPVGIILYRVLLNGTINLYIYIVLGFVILWILYRLMKGIYVLFDTKPGTVYLYSSLFIIAVIVAVLFYFELKHSTIQYLLFTLKQFNIF
jgi:beta-galactosidase